MTEASLPQHDIELTVHSMPPVATEAATSPDGRAAAIAPDGFILLQVRFRPDGEVNEIAGCPQGMSKTEWFKRLCARAGDQFQPRAGGRGFFKVSAAQLEALQVVQAQ